jgi:hypothetical protein
VKNEANAAYTESADLRLVFNTTRNAVMKTPDTPNQALHPTATRCAFTFSVIKIVQEIFSRAPGSRG